MVDLQVVQTMMKDALQVREIAQGFLMPKTDEERKDPLRMANCTAAVEVICAIFNIFFSLRTGTVNGAFTLTNDLVIGLNTNPFWVRNAGAIMPLMIAAVNAANDARELKTANESHWTGLQQQSENMWLEILPTVAFLCSGYGHMRLISVEMKKAFHGLMNG